MVAVKDFYWAKTGGKWKMTMCPLGQGMVDWPKFLKMLSSAPFNGPLTLHVEYEVSDEHAAIARDFEYLKKQVDAAYASS
jgi:sugar phosphate isomerase/epimerase